MGERPGALHAGSIDRPATSSRASVFHQIRIYADATVPGQTIDVGKLIVRQREIEDLAVLPDAFFVNGFGDNDNAVLQFPAQHNLRRCFSVFLSQPQDDRFCQHAALGDGRLGFHQHVARGAVQQIPLLRQIWMQLNLVDNRTNLTMLQERIQVMRMKIAHTDGADKSIPVPCLSRRGPRSGPCRADSGGPGHSIRDW